MFSGHHCLHSPIAAGNDSVASLSEEIVIAGAGVVVFEVGGQHTQRAQVVDAAAELAPGPLGVALAKEPAREAITARRQTDQMLAQLTRGDDFAELPGTQVEIARLTGLFDAPSVTTLTRAQASERVRVRTGAAYYAGVLDVRVKLGIEMLAPRSFGHTEVKDDGHATENGHGVEDGHAPSTGRKKVCAVRGEHVRVPVAGAVAR
jgi:hypothetical protein